MARKPLLTLEVYLAQEDLTPSEAARLFGVPRPTLERILNGGGTTVDTARQIHDATKGCVDWRTLGRDGGEPVTAQAEKWRRKFNR